MPLNRWEPFDEADRFLPGRFFRFPRAGELAVDVFEEKGNVVAKVSIPGIDPDNLDVTVEDDLFTVEGEREEEEEVDEKNYYSKEIRRGAFSRTVELPKTVDAKRAQARYEDGVLTVTMPAVEGEEARGVKVRVGT